MTGTYTPGRRDPREAWRAGALRGVTLATEHLLGAASQLAPIEEGVLSGTATASQEATPTGARGAVSFDTPYAVRQHEDLGLRHDPGRQAKYLEEPASTEAPVMARLVQQAIRAELGR